MSYRTKAASARRDKAKGRTAGLTEEQKQEIRCAERSSYYTLDCPSAVLRR